MVRERERECMNGRGKNENKKQKRSKENTYLTSKRELMRGNADKLCSSKRLLCNINAKISTVFPSKKGKIRKKFVYKIEFKRREK
jgi:hypothetical protein